MIAFRLCKKEDFNVWASLNRDFMEEEIQDEALWNDVSKVDDVQFYSTFSKALDSNELISLILFEEDEKIVGFANLMIIFSIWSQGKAMILDDLYLIPEIRSQGHGKEALELIETYAKEPGCKRLQFQSEVTNPKAMKFYIAVGYQPTDMKFYVKYL